MTKLYRTANSPRLPSNVRRHRRELRRQLAQQRQGSPLANGISHHPAILASRHLDEGSFNGLFFEFGVATKCRTTLTSSYASITTTATRTTSTSTLPTATRTTAKPTTTVSSTTRSSRPIESGTSAASSAVVWATAFRASSTTPAASSSSQESPRVSTRDPLQGGGLEMGTPSACEGGGAAALPTERHRT